MIRCVHREDGLDRTAGVNVRRKQMARKIPSTINQVDGQKGNSDGEGNFLEVVTG